MTSVRCAPTDEEAFTPDPLPVILPADTALARGGRRPASAPVLRAVSFCAARPPTFGNSGHILPLSELNAEWTA